MRTISEIAQVILDNINDFVVNGELVNMYKGKVRRFNTPEHMSIGLCHIISTLMHEEILDWKEGEKFVDRIYEDMEYLGVYYVSDSDEESKWLFAPGDLPSRLIYLKKIVDEGE